MSDKTTQTTCAYCGVGCGVTISKSNTTIAVSGDDAHPANFGRLCSKGLNLGETLDDSGRLLFPHINGERVPWDNAIQHVATEFNDIIAKHGPDAMAFYVSGQLLTEDYYVANKLMKGFIGSGNIDTNSRLCMSSAVAGYKRALGADAVPCNYDDLEQTDLLVLVGSNAAWCHPVLFRRIEAAKAARPDMKIVVIDPRKTASCDIADLHLPLKSGTDTTLYNGLLHYLAQHDAIDTAFIEQHTEGFDTALLAAQNASLASVAKATGLSPDLLSQFYDMFANTAKTISFYSMGLNQSTAGTDNANAIINVHLATGRIGKVGAGPFSITGQPNAMGGREVGGLANQLAAHMDIPNAAHRQLVSEFWKTDTLTDTAGAMAVDMFDKIHSGEIKAVWVMATNPVVSLPNADKVKAALEACELVVVSDCMAETDTATFADVLLPATGWGEKDGTVTNSERRISRQKCFLPAAGEAKHDWWIMTQVARAMGFADAFPYESPCDVFREHAQLSSYRNRADDIPRDFTISLFNNITEDEYENFTPVQWPVTPESPQGTARLFTDKQFYTANGKAKFIAITPKARAYLTCDEFPLVLNTGRIRDQWHTMTRTGKASKLHSHINEQYANIHPQDAEALGINNQQLVQIQSQWGAMLARANISNDVSKGSLFVPIHWNDHYASQGRVDALVNPAVDPVSAQPEFKHTPVKLSTVDFAWHGFYLSKADIAVETLSNLGIEYISRIKFDGGWRYELAGNSDQHMLIDWAKQQAEGVSECIHYQDQSQHTYRYGWIQANQLASALFIAPEMNLPSRQWLSSLFNSFDAIDAAMRKALLVGKPAEGGADCGEIICSCYGVGINTITTAIQAHRLASVESIGETVKAGTNCGSCKPELKQILAQFMQTYDQSSSPEFVEAS